MFKLPRPTSPSDLITFALVRTVLLTGLSLAAYKAAHHGYQINQDAGIAMVCLLAYITMLRVW
jgi:hypothetical protein